MTARRRPVEVEGGASFPVWARVVAGLVVAAIGLLIAFRRVDLAALGGALGEARWSWFTAAMAACVLAVLVRAWRWQALLLPIEKVGVEPLFSATMIGYFGNGVLPLRLGELMRAVAVGRGSTLRGGRLEVSSALGSIAVERLLDVVSALGVAALVVPFSGGFGGGIAAWAGAATIVIVAFGGLLWASRSPWVRSAIQARVEASGESRLGRLVASFLRGLLVLGEGPGQSLPGGAEGTGQVEPMRSGGAGHALPRLLPIGVATALIWALYAAAVWTAARAAGIPLSWIESGMVLLATTVAVSVPAAPGYVGTYHAAVVLVAADLLGHPTVKAQAFAILSHASSWLPTVAIGAICLLRSSMKLGEMTRLDAKAPRVSSPRP